MCSRVSKHAGFSRSSTDQQTVTEMNFRTLKRAESLEVKGYHMLTSIYSPSTWKEPWSKLDLKPTVQTDPTLLAPVCNLMQHCWPLFVIWCNIVSPCLQSDATLLAPVCNLMQHCWPLFANRSNIVGPCLQSDATCNTQQCCIRLQGVY